LKEGAINLNSLPRARRGDNKKHLLYIHNTCASISHCLIS